MRKSFEKFNGTHSITIGTEEIKCNEYVYDQFCFLTQGKKQYEELYTLMLDESRENLILTLSQMRKFLVSNDERGNVTLQDLQNAKTREQQRDLICELFVQKFLDGMIDWLLDEFTVEQIYRYRQNNGLSHPARLLTFSKQYALERFCS